MCEVTLWQITLWQITLCEVTLWGELSRRSRLCGWSRQRGGGGVLLYGARRALRGRCKTSSRGSHCVPGGSVLLLLLLLLQFGLLLLLLLQFGLLLLLLLLLLVAVLVLVLVLVVVVVLLLLLLLVVVVVVVVLLLLVLVLRVVVVTRTRLLLLHQKHQQLHSGIITHLRKQACMHMQQSSSFKVSGPLEDTCTLQACTTPAHCKHTLHLHIASIHYTCTLQAYTTLAHCKHTLHLHIASIHYTCTLQAYTTPAHCKHTLHNAYTLHTPPCVLLIHLVQICMCSKINIFLYDLWADGAYDQTSGQSQLIKPFPGL